ncbi:MAG: peptidoglycan-binding protein, partial [Ignavibacteria bacterium]|nr:peptidoglycan-binding protein [Ignavibacteria bacterium]
MLIKTVTFCIVLLFLFQPGCKQESPQIEKTLNEKLNFSYSKYQEALRNSFSGDDLNNILADSSFQYFDSLKHFYSTRNFQPVYITSFEKKDLVYSLLTIFYKADEHGINPEHYYPGLIEKEFFEAINDTINIPGRYNHLATAEILISYAILKYNYHMRYGLVNPKDLFPDSYYLPVAELSQTGLYEPLKQIKIIQYLQDVQPKSERYKKLQTALLRFKTFNDPEWTVIPIPDEKLEPGDKNSLLILIANKLISLGFLDTSKITISDYTIYDSLLVDPIKEFQQVNGLNDDGVIGKNTIYRLNITPREYVDKIKINLERFRW